MAESKRFFYKDGMILDFQSDFRFDVSDVSVTNMNACKVLIEKLNSLDDEKWEYKKKYNNLRSRMFKIHKMSKEEF